jgi:hypothetical protein
MPLNVITVLDEVELDVLVEVFNEVPDDVEELDDPDEVDPDKEARLFLRAYSEFFGATVVFFSQLLLKVK